MSDATPEPRSAGRRRTLISARAEPVVWLIGLSLLVCVALVVTLVAMVFANGSRTFWPRPVDLVTLRSGERLMGVPMEEQAFAPSGELAAALEAFRASGQEALPGAFDEAGAPVRRLYRVANKEVEPDPFRWVPLWEVASIERPRDAAFVERMEWGVWIGTPRAIFTETPGEAPAEPSPEGESRDPGTGERLVRRVTGPPVDGRVPVLERRYLVEGSDAVWRVLDDRLAEATQRRREIAEIDRGELGATNRRLEAIRLQARGAAIAQARAESEPPPMLSWGGWIGVALGAGATGVAAGLLGSRGRASAGRRVGVASLWVACAGLGLLAVLERPWGRGGPAPGEVERVQQAAAEREGELQAEYQRLLGEINRLREADQRVRIEFVDAKGRLAPTRQASPDDPMLLSQVVRAVRVNDLSTGQKVGLFLSRWAEFLSDWPRANNTEGGVFPVIFGTVLMTVLLSVVAVPLGVVAALYLREYATQGFVTSLVRIAVNNLAGVPSIVYGVFGVGFFCYGLGGFLDGGPAPEEVTPRFAWWWLIAAAGLVVVMAVGFGAWSRVQPGEAPGRRHRVAAGAGVALWLAAAGLALAAVAGTPYFHGFFNARLPSPTFGTPGLLWASLTLALLTLPVVIVATEEAIAAVPRSMREGSYGCGASKWQTLRRIVLPAAAPGIMTGMILAMARGAGEVAPLMLVGAVKFTSVLPFSGEPPFMHPERSFMHLGFHIYDLGFQSPDSEASQPLVWTTTLLLITVVLLLNLTAITIRARLRAKLTGGTF